MILNQMRSFPAGIAEKLQSYVYLYVDPEGSGEPFYIGKGVGNRVFAHLREADSKQKISNKVKKIREIWARGKQVQLVIHRYGMSEQEAFNVESALIDLFPKAQNEVGGNETIRGALPIEEVVAHFRPQTVRIDFPCVVLTISEEWKEVYKHRLKGDLVEYDKALYTATRARWRVQPKSHLKVRHAIAWAGSVIRQVYEIDQWRLADVDSSGKPQPLGKKYMFDGSVAQEHQHLIDATLVSDQLPKVGAQNSVRYLNG